MTTEALIQDSVVLLRRMVATPSPTFGEDEVCRLVESAFAGWGMDFLRMGNNIICSDLRAGAGAPTLVMDAHLDTVPAAASYTRDPFDPGNDPDTVWGLGSNDDGGSVAAMTAAFRNHLQCTSPKVNLILCLVCEEERAGKGGSQLIYGAGGPFADGTLPRPDSFIVGEPTGMKAATSERGLLVIDAEAKGVSGHAARNEGVNALYIAMDDIQALRSHVFGRHSDIMGDVKLNVTQIQAGTAHNVIPDSCRFVVDIRPTDRYTNTEIVGELQALCRSALTPRNLNNKSSATPAGSRLARTIAALGLETFSSPTTSDWIRIDGDAVKMGPGDSSRSHKADEYILTEEIASAVKGYIQFIEEYGNIVE